MLLTRLPLTPKSAFDLHVLSLPPAFVLSQDQTLMFEILRQVQPKPRPTLILKSHYKRRRESVFLSNKSKFARIPNEICQA